MTKIDDEVLELVKEYRQYIKLGHFGSAEHILTMIKLLKPDFSDRHLQAAERGNLSREEANRLKGYRGTDHRRNIQP